jgi:hypothetical protein
MVKMNGPKFDRTLESFMVKLFDMALNEMREYSKTGKIKHLRRSILFSQGLNDVYEKEARE